MLRLSFVPSNGSLLKENSRMDWFYNLHGSFFIICCFKFHLLNKMYVFTRTSYLNFDYSEKKLALDQYVFRRFIDYWWNNEVRTVMYSIGWSLLIKLNELVSANTLFWKISLRICVTLVCLFLPLIPWYMTPVNVSCSNIC